MTSPDINFIWKKSNPMVETLFIDGKWKKEIVLGNEVIEFLRKEHIESVALFASVQFLELERIKQQLKDNGIAAKTTKAKRTDAEAQILGCDAYHDSFKENIIADADAILYIGDGMFHPKALLLAQKGNEEGKRGEGGEGERRGEGGEGKETRNIKDIIIWDPIAEKMSIIGKKEIERQLLKAKANYTRYLAANTIGILVTIKPGQQYLVHALKLKEKLEHAGKKAFIFIDSTIDLKLLENYPFIDAWVNTACPRIGMDDIVNVGQAVVNVNDAKRA